MAECLVTGGAGFIGSHVVRGLVDKGFNVRVLDNFSSGRHDNLESVKTRIDVQVGDIRDDDALFNAMLGVRYVFHLAALPSVPKSVEDPLSTHKVNITGTLRLLLRAREANVERVVLSSSSAVYGNTDQLPSREDHVPKPTSPYALSKLADEHYFRLFYELYGLRTYALRYFNVFGPRQNPRSQYAAVVPLFIEALLADAHPTIFGDGTQTRDFLHVSDVVRANLACIDAPDAAAGGVFNVAWGTRLSINDLAHMMMRVFGVSRDIIYAPPREGDIKDSQADISLAQNVLGWNPVMPFEEGLEETIAWFKKQTV